MHFNPAQLTALDHAFHHPFKAVAFDVDGTLTHFARFLIPVFMAEALVQIPENIPRAICTGRDLKFIHTQLEHICSHSPDPQKEQSRWTIFSENGGQGYRWNARKKDYESWFEVPWPAEPKMDTLEAFGKDKLGSQGIFLLREHTMVIRHPDWVYLSPKFTRFMSRRSHRKMETLFAKNSWNKDLMIQDSGIGNVILPKASGKGHAMLRWAKELGVPVHDILVIGDQPEVGGNDEDFLSGHHGTAFSVGGLTHNVYPLPVLSHRGTPMKGPEATSSLLRRVEWGKW